MSATSFTNNGVRDWYWQRLSALVIASYSLFLMGYIAICGPLTFSKWHVLFNHPIMRIATIIVLMNLIIHAWVGVWTIFTDYVKCATLQLCLQSIMILALLSYFFWGVQILMA
ncbi:MAG: succinate dehydrogenase, hydrophobic membrane anchor protein [Gammaproteobacteria bacterium]